MEEHKNKYIYPELRSKFQKEADKADAESYHNMVNDMRERLGLRTLETREEQ